MSTFLRSLLHRVLHQQPAPPRPAHLGLPLKMALAIGLITSLTIVTLLFSHALTVHAANTSYYVDCSATTNGNGSSQSSPWNTLASVNATTFGPGDSIHFLAGTACSGQLHPLGSGSSVSPITISLYGSGPRPRIDGNGTVAATVLLSNQQYWDIENLEITNTATSNDASRLGVRVENTLSSQLNHIHILNLSIHDVTGYSAGYYGDNGAIAVVDAGGNTQSLWNDVQIANNTINHVDRVGIFVGPDNNSSTGGKPTNVVIQNNTINNAGDAILTYVVNAPLVQHNVASNNGARVGSGTCETTPLNYCNSFYATIWENGVNGGIFQYNEVYGNAAGGDSEAFDLDLNTTNTIYQYNYSHNNAGGFLLDISAGSGNIVRYNISQNEVRAVVNFVGNVSDVHVYNNTFYVGSGQGTDILYNYGPAVSGNYQFTNNIIDNLGSGNYVTQNGSALADPGTWDHNVFYGNHPTYEPTDTNKLTSNPLFLNPGGATSLTNATAYELQSGSPALSSGTVISNNGGQDFYGNTVSATAVPNRGASNGAPPQGPTGYSFCAYENGTCTLNWTETVAYGANGLFNYQTLSGTAACNTSTFGDPNYGVVEACYVQN